MSLRNAITEGLADAEAADLFTPSFINGRSAEDLVEELTGFVMVAVRRAVDRGDFTVFDTPGTGHPGFRSPGTAEPFNPLDLSEYTEFDRTLIESGPVATVDATVMVAMLAEAAHRLNPVVPDLSQDETQMRIEVIDGDSNHRAFRQFLFAIQPMFGVRTRVHVTDGEATFTVGGLRDDVRAFRLVVETFAALTDTLAPNTDVDHGVLWATIGSLAAGTERAIAQTEASTDRFANATTYLNSRFGRARTLRRAQPALDGPVRDLAVGALADAATRLG